MNSREARARSKHWLRRAQETQRDALALIERGGSPEGIVNRTYYAMFYAVLALLRSVGQEVSDEAGAASAFQRDYIKSRSLPRKLWKALEEAARLARQAEAEDGGGISNDQAFESYNAAVEFIRRVEQRLREPA